jgi:CubicO group peptidase (beta-lactamase class C family)
VPGVLVRDRLKQACFAAVAVALVAGCVREVPKPAVAAPAVVFPGAQWERIDRPESAGFSAAKLEVALAFVRGLDTTGLVVISGGRVLVDYGNTTELSYLASVRKSVLAMLFGNYVASGKVRLDKTLAELGIDDVGGLTPQEQEATIADLLSARSGVYHPGSNSGDDLASAPPRGSQPHGTYFLYSNWDFNVLGTIFEQETGRDIYDALETDVAKPIGMEDFRRDAQKKSGDVTLSKHPAYHVWLSTRDMARLGYLMLREGSWAGQQVIPRDWVRKITQPVTRLEQMNPPKRRELGMGYGYLWWVFDDAASRNGPLAGAYTGMGAVGQFVTVIPKLDLVIAHKTVPKDNRAVPGQKYLALVDLIVAARCEGACGTALHRSDRPSFSALTY